MEAFVIAFSMYSKIPMPKVEWNEKNMKYAICFFPMVGVVIGIVSIAVFYLCGYLQIGLLLRSILLASVPILITGGIHMDGYLDTIDARASYGEQERKLAILKDPHAGAFAVIWGILYFLLQVGFMGEMTLISLPYMAIGYVLSRAYSGLAITTFNSAREKGSLDTFAKGANKKIVTGIMLFVIVICIGTGVFLNVLLGIVSGIAGLLVFGYYRYFSYREFGGITGDLAGFFLQLFELVILIVIVTAGKLV